MNWTVKKTFDFHRQRGVEVTAQAKAQKGTFLSALGDSQAPCGWTLGKDWWDRTLESPADVRVEGLKYQAEELGESKKVCEHGSITEVNDSPCRCQRTGWILTLEALCSGTDCSTGRENT